ncbi:MAG: hypothetical protein NW237_10785 [Cyanobacteriota bacterium]|nr:hypothetical protein [Cyanobacteriota bacterium]
MEPVNVPLTDQPWVDLWLQTQDPSVGQEVVDRFKADPFSQSFDPSTQSWDGFEQGIRQLMGTP